MARILPITPMLMRGLGPGQALITLGLGPIIGELVRIFRGGRTVVRDIYGYKIEEFKIAINLFGINGKDLLKPIITKRIYKVDETDVSTKITIANVNVSKHEQKEFNVIAKILKVKRGKDGKN